MMSKRISFFILLLIPIYCQGQVDLLQRNNNFVNCNQEVYGTKKYIKNLPNYLCIPKDFIIDDYVRFSDKDKNGKNDFIAIKYNKKEDDQIDGDTTYWVFFDYNIIDSVYQQKFTLTNIVPLYIKSISYSYLAKNSYAEKLFNLYPRRMSHNLSFVVKNDMIRLSYKLDDVYGKTFVFIYNNIYENWFLQDIEYFIGELAPIWWRNNEFYYPLRNNVLVIEKIKPKQNISIDKFSLIEGFKYRELESDHLSKYINNINEDVNKSILQVELSKDIEIQLPKDWIY